MGTVHPLRTAAAAPTLPTAIARFLAAPSARRLPLAETTRDTYGKFLMLLYSPARRGEHRAAPFGPGDPVTELRTPTGAEKLLTWFRTRHAGVAGATWNTHRACLRSACDYWRTQGWLADNPAEELETRGVPHGAPRTRPREDIAVLLDRRDLPLRDRTLWALLYESAARVHEVLELDVQDVDLDNRRAQVGRKGGAADVIAWGPHANGLLRRYIGTRTRGPLFLTDRKAKRNLDLDPVDRCPDTGRARLSYRRAEEILGHVAGWDPHDLRHSSLTHDAEDGMPLPLLLTKSGHQSIRSAQRYLRPSIDAVDRWQAEHSPGRRRSQRRRR